MPFRRFKRRFDYVDPELGKITIPRGWSGEVNAAVAKEADAGGHTYIEKPSSAQAASDTALAKGSAKTVTKAEREAIKREAELAAQHQAKLEAARAAVTTTEEALGKAETDEAKAELGAILADAKTALAALEA